MVLLSWIVFTIRALLPPRATLHTCEWDTPLDLSQKGDNTLPILAYQALFACFSQKNNALNRNQNNAADKRSGMEQDSKQLGDRNTTINQSEMIALKHKCSLI